PAAPPGGPPFCLLCGVMPDKDVEAMTRLLFPPAHAVVLTRAPTDRAATPEEIARRAAGAAREVRIEARPRPALALARRLAPAGGRRVAAGGPALRGRARRSR